MANELEKINNSDSGLVKQPLLFYPELCRDDIMQSNVLDSLQKQVVIASLNYPKIRTLNISKGETGHPNTPEYDILVDIIALAIWTMGITEKSMTKQEQLMFIPIAIEEIKTFPNLSIEDVRIAFNRGSRRKYGDTLQMSIATVNIWLTKYQEETKYEAMLNLKYIKPKDHPKPELTNEQKEKIRLEWIENVYQAFDKTKETGEYDYYDFNNTLYNYLKKLGIISLTEKQQEKLWNMAVEELKTEYHPKNGRNFGQRLHFKAVYDGLKLDELDKKSTDLIITRAKKLTVKWLFKKYIKENKHLREIIEEKLKKK